MAEAQGPMGGPMVNEETKLRMSKVKLMQLLLKEPTVTEQELMATARPMVQVTGLMELMELLQRSELTVVSHLIVLVKAIKAQDQDTWEEV